MLSELSFCQIDFLNCTETMIVLIPIVLFIVILVFYHIAEYLLQLHFHPETTTISSLLITKAILLAYSVGVCEYFIESCLIETKGDMNSIFFWAGIIMTFVGLFIRFAAILTAGKSFTHLVSYRKKKDHVLVTGGIYKYFRHPSYFGFFLFAVGTQVMLKNPISIIGFSIVLWAFFDDRIKDEEIYLVEFFGKDYEEYRARTPTRIPFIK